MLDNLQISPVELDELIARWLREDLNAGDITSRVTLPMRRQITGYCIAKQPLVLCGIGVFTRVFALLDPSVQITSQAADGELIAAKSRILSLCGEIHSILAGERVALNILQHLSGIATTARAFAEAVAHTKASVTDTRKTIPGLRFLQRYAVRVGGCKNHRNDLGSGILIKENHIRGAGSIETAISSARKQAPHTLRIEVEVSDLHELQRALDCGADIILLDNMTPKDITNAVEITQLRAILEASGNITLDNVKSYAETGVDIISTGALTHSPKAADISLLLDV
jgi:nicotinate-nucleotide pyrophosphorylase (carboxylating)